MWNIEEIERFLEEQVQVVGFPDDIATRLDFLDSVLDVLRHKHMLLERKTPFEKFLQCEVGGGEKLICVRPDKFEALGSGTSSKFLQPDLLIFLMLFHRQEYRVIDIIERFVQHPRMRKKLTQLDFKRTETGVTRCFTNTRVAATTLREYGLLRFTREEAYKTWRLTLVGFVTASIVFKRLKLPDYREFDRDNFFPLHQEIYHARASVDDFSDFVMALASICEPNADLFGKEIKVLEKGYSLLQRYFAVLHDKNLDAKERREACQRYVDEMEKDIEIDDFKTRLASCIMVDDLLKQLEPPKEEGQ